MTHLDIISCHVFVNYICQYNFRGICGLLTELIILHFNIYYFFVLCQLLVLLLTARLRCAVV